MELKQITNPMLVGAMELLKAEDTKEHRQMVIDQALKAKFLTPGIIDPPPVPDETGKVKLTKENRINVPMLTGSDGKNYFMAFTDMGELEKWKKQEKQNVFVFRFVQYATMLLKNNENCNGLVINPYSNNLVMNREMINAIIHIMQKK